MRRPSVSKKGYREHPTTAVRVEYRSYRLSAIGYWLLFLPMRPDELERKRTVEAGGSVIVNVRKTKGRRADEDLIRWAEESGRFVYIGDAVRHTHYQRSPWFNPAKGRKTNHDRAVNEDRSYILKRPDLLARLSELRGKVLGCWCYPKACHGNILIELGYGKE